MQRRLGRSTTRNRPPRIEDECLALALYLQYMVKSRGTTIYISTGRVLRYLRSRLRADVVRVRSFVKRLSLALDRLAHNGLLIRDSPSSRGKVFRLDRDTLLWRLAESGAFNEIVSMCKGLNMENLDSSKCAGGEEEEDQDTAYVQDADTG